MKRLILSLFVVLLGATSAMAQTTTEAIIGLCPQLPSVAQLASVNQDAVERFEEEINKAIKQGNKAIEQRAEQGAQGYIDSVNKDLKEQYGKSADEFAAMSEGELERFGEAYAKQQLQGLGINKSASEIERMSDDEKEQMATQMAANMLGLSASDMQSLAAMENMSDEEALAYMQQSGLLSKMQSKGASISKRGQSKGVTTSSKSAQQLAEYMAIEQEYNNEVATFISQRNKNREALYDSALNLYRTKYEARLDALRKQLGEVMTDYTACIGNDEALKAQMVSLEREITALETEYRAKIAAPWLDQILSEMAQIKSLITSARRADKASEAKLKLMGEPVYPQSNDLSWAVEYLHTASSVTEFMPGL